VVHFGSYGTAALDPVTGRTLWQRTDLPCRHYRGPGSSPIAYADLVILTMDGVDVQYLVALDARTGETKWTAPRTAEWNDLGPDGRPAHEGDLRKAFSTPLVRPYEGRVQLWSVGAKAMYGYDPATGKELWKLAHPAYSAAARPVFGEGVLVVCPGPGRPEMWGVRPGQGSRPPELLWRRTRRAPHIPSPILVGRWLVAVTDDGTLFCLDPRTGTEHWSVRLGGTFCASPVCLDGDRIVVGNVQGTMYVFRAGGQYLGLSTNRLDAGLMASPAVADGALFLRTTSHLYRIEARP
jgi:outer membrane protein assembly factor BamB